MIYVGASGKQTKYSHFQVQGLLIALKFKLDGLLKITSKWIDNEKEIKFPKKFLLFWKILPLLLSLENFILKSHISFSKHWVRENKIL